MSGLVGILTSLTPKSHRLDTIVHVGNRYNQQELSTNSQAAASLLSVPLLAITCRKTGASLVMAGEAVKTPVDTAISQLQCEDIRSVTPGGQCMHGIMLDCILRCLVTHINQYDPAGNRTLCWMAMLDWRIKIQTPVVQ
eukprot:scaffold216054_cov28-Prasinocladus_malaysianus.AAC.1